MSKVRGWNIREPLQWFPAAVSKNYRDIINFPLFPTAYQEPEVTSVLPYRLKKTQPPSKLSDIRDETGGNSPKGKQALQFFLFNSSENKGNIKLLDMRRRGGRKAVMLSVSSRQNEGRNNTPSPKTLTPVQCTFSECKRLERTSFFNNCNIRRLLPLEKVSVLCKYQLSIYSLVLYCFGYMQENWINAS